MSTFSFYSTIPQASDNPSVSQGQILQNFTSIPLWSAQDHYAYGTGTDGQHKWLNFPVNVAAPTPSGTQGAIYPVLDTNNALQLNWINKSGTVNLTGIPIVTGTAGASGYGFKTPWGITVNWGAATATGAGTNIIFQQQFTSAPQSIQLTVKDNAGAFSVSTGTSPSTTAFTAYVNNASPIPIWFLAWGV